MRERMEEMQRQMHDFVQYIQQEVMARAQGVHSDRGAIVPIRRAVAEPESPAKARKK
jgi:MerR family transcriptional regulator/heat shock protein HspR